MIKLNKLLVVFLLSFVSLGQSQGSGSGPLTLDEDKWRSDNCGKYDPTESAVMFSEHLLTMAISQRHVMFSTADTPLFDRGTWVRRTYDQNGQRHEYHYSVDVRDKDCQQDSEGIVDWMEIPDSVLMDMFIHARPQYKILKATYFGFCKGANANPNTPSGIIIGETNATDLKPICLSDFRILDTITDVTTVTETSTNYKGDYGLSIGGTGISLSAPIGFIRVWHPWSLWANFGGSNQPFIKKIDGVWKLLGFARGDVGDKNLNIQVYPFAEKIEKWFNIKVERQGSTVGALPVVPQNTTVASTTEPTTVTTEPTTVTTEPTTVTTEPTTVTTEPTTVTTEPTTVTTEPTTVTTESTTVTTESTTVTTDQPTVTSDQPTVIQNQTTGAMGSTSDATTVFLQGSTTIRTTDLTTVTTSPSTVTSPEPKPTEPTQKGLPESAPPELPEPESQESEDQECPEDMMCFEGTIEDLIKEMEE